MTHPSWEPTCQGWKHHLSLLLTWTRQIKFQAGSWCWGLEGMFGAFVGSLASQGVVLVGIN